MGDVLDRFFDQIDYLQQHRGEVVGVATGFSDLDQLTGGLQRSDLIIVAARPSMGKTSLALGMAYGAAVGHGKTVGIFSLEMSAEQLVQRVLSMETGSIRTACAWGRSTTTSGTASRARSAG